MLAVYVVMLILAAGGAAGGQAQSSERPRTLCGPKLAEAHALYCFSTEKVQKRSMILPLTGTLYGYGLAEARPLMSALALTARNKRLPGLVDECCYKPCYVSELLSYCET